MVAQLSLVEGVCLCFVHARLLDAAVPRKEAVSLQDPSSAT